MKFLLNKFYFDVIIKATYDNDRTNDENNEVNINEKRKSIENAINFLRLGVDIETASKGTELSIEK